jgi:thioredoxin-related protein
MQLIKLGVIEIRRRVTALVFAALIIAMFAAASVNAQSGIAWHADQEGMQIAKSQNKPAMIIFYSDRCPACAKLEDELADIRVIDMSNNFVPIVGSGGLDRLYGIRYVPTLVFTNSQGEEVYRLVGYYDADTLIEEMQYAIRLSSNPVQPPFQDPYAEKTPGFGVVTAVVALFICGLWIRRSYEK